MAWSPRWRASVDGKEVEPEHAGFGLIRIPLGSGEHRVVLEHRPTAWDVAGALLSALVATLVLAPVVRRRWRYVSSWMSRRRSLTA